MSLARVAVLITAALAASTAVARDALPRAVGRAFLDHGVPLNRVAIVVHEIGKPKPLFAYDAERPMNPASVMKLVTTFAALEILGRDYRWKTEAYLGGPILNRMLKGDRKSTRLKSSHRCISYAVFCLKKKNTWKD